MFTKYQLTQALFTGGPLHDQGGPIRFCFHTVNAIEREDGSGKSFNVTGINHNGDTETVHVRTID